MASIEKQNHLATGRACSAAPGKRRYLFTEVLPYVYNEGAREFDRKWKRYNECAYHLARDLLDNMGGAPRRILEVGCGTGNMLSILQDRFPAAALTGIDPSYAMLEQARIKMPHTRLLEGDIFIPLKEPFDLITAISVFHYVEKPEDWLARAAVLLRPCGSLLLIDWNGSTPLMRMRKRRLQRIPHIEHIYTEQEMDYLLEKWKRISYASKSCIAGWWSLQGHLVGVGGARHTTPAA